MSTETPSTKPPSTDDSYTTIGSTMYAVHDVADKTFRKTSKLPVSTTGFDGTICTRFRSWNHERIENEAKALELIAKKTTIPVPRLVEHGKHADGCRYIITELIDGVTVSSLDDPSRYDRAVANAQAFVEDEVLPQLAKLKSNERGLEGFVMPPRWLDQDVLPPWRGTNPPGGMLKLPLPTAEYVFQHGDLAPQNVLVDRETLQVKALVGWEYAGYYPPDMDGWSGTLAASADVSVAKDIALKVAEYLPEDFLARCEEWQDKGELAWLAELRQIPDPAAIRKQLAERDGQPGGGGNEQ